MNLSYFPKTEDVASLDSSSSWASSVDTPPPPYISPEKTISALQEIALISLSPSALALAQESCPDIKNHREGKLPKSVVVADVDMAGTKVLCEVSDPKNPRPMVPISQRNLVVNLLHHGDHPSAKETLRRTTKDYYWPNMRKNVVQFVKTCHPCQSAKQSATEKSGIGHFPVPDERFSYIHIDVVGPLPESRGYKYLLSVLDRTSHWLELYPMKSASAAECAEAFLQSLARFGAPATAVSDNGNSFVSRLWEDINRIFGVDIVFTPAYHAATNGAVERAHQTFKNSLKASLVAMGDEHRENWFTALPWVLLGKRNQYQPHLDASSSQLVLGKSVKLPGMVLGQAGPPLNTAQTKALLDQLYKMSDRPPIQTSAPYTANNMDHTLSATHVYVKKANPLSLESKFEGPFEILSRPSRSTIIVKIGCHVDGSPRTLNLNWNSCKIAHLRDDAQVGSRPTLGRPAKRPSPSTSGSQLTRPDPPPIPIPKQAVQPVAAAGPSNSNQNNETRGNIQTSRPVRVSRNPAPKYV